MNLCTTSWIPPTITDAVPWTCTGIRLVLGGQKTWSTMIELLIEPVVTIYYNWQNSKEFTKLR